MPDDPYSLADLARLADVTPRTIRYYVTQGLLPSPAAAGPATRYTEGHLLRLKLIKRLQRDHLPLAEIRSRLERAGDEEITAALEAASQAAPEPDPGAGATVAFVRSLMARSNVVPTFHDQPMPEPPAARVAAVPAPAPMVRAMRLAALAPPTTPSTPRSPVGDRSTWERVSLSSDVELHIRRPLDRQANRRVDKLLQIALDLFRDDS